MQCRTDTKRPKSDPFRTVYTARKAGKWYRVARDQFGRGWRLDVAWFGIYEAVDPTVYPSRDAAVRAFEAL